MIMGSSPLARGTQRRLGALSIVRGLIPARAGNTALTVRLSPALRAHPRSRGEHRDAARGLSVEPGSSPLARGTQVTVKTGEFNPGLIPARAGNTKVSYPFIELLGAHPRSRGEHASSQA